MIEFKYNKDMSDKYSQIDIYEKDYSIYDENTGKRFDLRNSLGLTISFNFN